MKPKVLVLKADGTNCDEEMAYAFKIAGADAKIVHVNQLRDGSEKMSNYQILALPGGFAYGDDIISGKILAIELTSFLETQMKKFIERKDTAIIGLCNGFQVLVRTGLLPFRKMGEMDVTLTNNDSGHFECRWIKVKINGKNNSPFLKGMGGRILNYTVAHGEGKFFTDGKTLRQIEEKNLVAFRYVDDQGNPTQNYPDNPNGALNAVMGITDTTGRILGMMPHPERATRFTQLPDWTLRAEQLKRAGKEIPNEYSGTQIFKNGVGYFK